MSKSPTKSTARIMQEKPAKAMAGTKAKWHGKRRTDRGTPRRACKYRPCKHQAHGAEGSKKECHQDGPRSTKRRPADREAVIMPEWLTHRYHQEERIDETDQDQQYCRVTD
jgi:hypothetical protein